MPNQKEIDQNDPIKAIVKLATCCGNRSTCPYTSKCSHSVHGNACAERLREEYGYVLDSLNAVLGVTSDTTTVRRGDSDMSLTHTVTGIIHELGIPAHIKGYAYVREAIIMVVNKPTLIEAVTKELYPALAAIFGTTPSRVERAIRHAVEVAWDRGDFDTLQSYFGSTVSRNKGKPTNSEFISLIAERIRIGM